MRTNLPITVGMLSYNNEKFIAAAIEGVLGQTYPSLEFVICDDGSSDASYEIAEKITRSYAGPYKIRLYRNEKNLGLIANYNRLFSLAEGELIIQAQADDVSLPYRVENIVEAYLRGNRSARYLASAFMRIDENDQELGQSRFLPRRIDAFWLLSTAEALTGATAAVHRSVFDVFGPIPETLYSEDRLLPLRASLLGDVVYVDKPLLKYRRHGNNRSRNTDNYLSFSEFCDEVIGIKQAIPETFSCFLDDQKTLARSDHRPTVDLAMVERATIKFLALSNHELSLIHGSKAAGFRTLFRIIALGVGVRIVLRDLFFKFFPHVVYVSRKIRH